METKYYIGILAALILALQPAKSQYSDSRDFINYEAGVVINNYYDDYDYYYSSRINRFHRSYAAFDYYSPVFTDTYWYSYRPFSWGVSIYGRSGLGFGYSINFPVYYGMNYYNWYDSYYGYYDPYSYGWYDSYWGSPYYYGYNPFYSAWYSPVVFNIGFGNRWRHNYWYGHNHWYGNRYRYNDYRYGYRSDGRYSSSRYYSNSNGRSEYDRPSGINPSRRPEAPVQRNEVNRSTDRIVSAGRIAGNGTVSQRSSTPSRTAPAVSQRSSSPSRSGPAMSQRSSSPSRSAPAMSRGSSSGRSSSSGSRSSGSSGNSSSDRSRR